jgi:hypothetical protein
MLFPGLHATASSGGRSTSPASITRSCNAAAVTAAAITTAAIAAATNTHLSCCPPTTSSFCLFLFTFRHNSHHAFPQSARHGLEWWEIDLTWYVICALQAVGLVWDVHVPSEKAKALKCRKPAPVQLTAKAE